MELYFKEVFMKLDNEQQRQQLMQIINALPINGNLGQVTQTINTLIVLMQTIEGAEIDKPPLPSVQKEEETK